MTSALPEIVQTACPVEMTGREISGTRRWLFKSRYFVENVDCSPLGSGYSGCGRTRYPREWCAGILPVSVESKEVAGWKPALRQLPKDFFRSLYCPSFFGRALASDVDLRLAGTKVREIMPSETIQDKIQAGIPHEASRPVKSSPAELDIEKELDELRRSSDWERGIVRKVLIRYPDFQITLRAMKANARIPEHHNPGRICVQTVKGHIRMHADGRLFDLPVGKALVLDRAVIHDVEALEESAFLLTVALPEASGR